MLVQQHRMATPIRKMVSDFAYNGQLTDSNSIGTREAKLPQSILAAVPNFNICPLLYMNLDSDETKVIKKTFSNLFQKAP